VQVAGATSWRLRVTDSDLAETALFVRDALGLVRSSSVDSPPALAAPVANMRDLLTDRERSAASAQWLQWWQQIVGFELGAGRPLETSMAGHGVLGVLAGLRANSDPPAFSALADRPELRKAVRAGFEHAMRWQRERRTRHSDSTLEWSVIKRAADDVAFDRHVSVDSLRGVVAVLPVAGLWWRRHGPGQILCSEEAASSAQTSYQIAYEVFATSIDG
jgi:hypothetical protein